MNKVLEKFKAKEPSYGSFTHLKSITGIESIGATGLDYLIIDMEHSPTAINETASLFTACDSVGMTPLVRINSVTRSAVLSVLDAGAKGIIVPCIETVEQVKALVEYAKFTPVGKRGYCPTRDGLWGLASSYDGGMQTYMEFSNSDTLLIPQCETLGCYENIEEIAAIEGVDGIMVGPYDLSIAMGIPGQFGDPDFNKAIMRILEVTHANGKIAVIFTGDADGASAWADKGFDSVIISLDALILIDAYKAILDKLRPKQ